MHWVTCTGVVLSAVLLVSTAGQGNPIAGHTLYVNPTYVAELDSSIATANGTVKDTLSSM